MHFQILTLLLIAGLSAATGCKEVKTISDAGDEVIIVVNGTPITEAEVAVKLQQMGSHGTASGPGLRERAIEEIVVQELMYQKGRQLGLDRDGKFRNAVRLMELRINEFKRSEMERQIRNTQIAAKVEVTQEDVKKYYDAHREAISTDLRIAAVRFSDEEEARAASEKIKVGKPFEDVARERLHQLPGNSKPSWDMGFLHWNQIPMEWADAVYALNKGEVSSILSSKRSGVFLVKLLERKKNPEADFGRMSASIMNRLRDLRVLQAYERYIEELKKDAKIIKQEERRKAS